MPQVHGAVQDALDHLRRVLDIELNSATDNPLVFAGGGVAPVDALATGGGRVISGGNFHGEPIALALDFAKLALAELGSISERRTALLVDPRLNGGLPPFLAPASGIDSGMMIYQYTAAALAIEHKVLAHPASVDSIPTSANQEDHVSMGATSPATRDWSSRGVERILSIELLVATQALDLRLAAAADAPSPGVGVGEAPGAGPSGGAAPRRGSRAWSGPRGGARARPPRRPRRSRRLTDRRLAQRPKRARLAALAVAASVVGPEAGPAQERVDLVEIRLPSRPSLEPVRGSRGPRGRSRRSTSRDGARSPGRCPIGRPAAACAARAVALDRPLGGDRRWLARRRPGRAAPGRSAVAVAGAGRRSPISELGRTRPRRIGVRTRSKRR